MGSRESYRVLLVDDDAPLLESVAAVLADQFGVRRCASGREALRPLEREACHVVCADWQMPDLDGVKFFHAVARRKLDLLPCFMLVTAHAGELLDQVPDEDRKMLGMLRKPFSREQLLDRVNQFAGVAHLKRSNATPKAAVLGGRK